MTNIMYDEINVKKALVEVEKILERLSEYEYKKIPEDIKLYIQENKDSEYVWNYDEKKSLEEQNLNECTLPMLAYINTEFLLNDEQKEYMQNIYAENDKKFEQELREKYNPEDIFKNRHKEAIEETKEQENVTTMVEYKESILTKFVNYIKRILKKRKEG